VVVLTPLRVLFLIVLVGTTLEVLTERSRQVFKVKRWRNKVHDHTVVIGFGTKGRSAVAAMLGDDVDPRASSWWIPTPPHLPPPQPWGW